MTCSRSLEAQPMRSVKLGPGAYEVLGTSQHVEVIRVQQDDGPWWALVVEGEWAQFYVTKREALQACQSNPNL